MRKIPVLSFGYDSRESWNSGYDFVVIDQDPDVLDTWFSSGLWPIGTLGWPEDTEELKKYFPTSVLVTGFDIIFFWVARMMMMQLEVTGKHPFDTVYVHSLVRDEKGKKMSKSLGNVIDPLDLIDRYGADAVRFTLASMATMGRDLKLAESRVEGYRNFGTKLWNATRFAEMNGARFGSDRPAASAAANRWIMGELARAVEGVDAALTAFRFDEAARVAYDFTWKTLCDWYLELAKPLLDGDLADETRMTLGWTIDRTLALLHPFMPFITESLWGTTATRGGMLAVTAWPEHLPTAEGEASAEIQWVISLIEAVRSVRGEMGVAAAAKLNLLALELSEQTAGWLEANAALIARLARIEGVEAVAEAPKGAATIPLQGATFALPLAGVIDVAAEKARLDKALGKIGKELGGLRGRLNNPKFRESAPPEVVEETEGNLAAREAEEARLKTARARLDEMDG